MSCSVRSALRKLIGRHASFDGIGHGRAEDIDDVAALGRRLVAKLLSLFLDQLLELCGIWFEAFLDGLNPGFHLTRLAAVGLGFGAAPFY